MTNEYFSLTNPFLVPLKVTAGSFAVLLVVVVVIACCRREAGTRWYDVLLAGMLTISFVGSFVLALDVDKFDPSSRISANVSAKYDVSNVKTSGEDPSYMTVQIALPDGLRAVYDLTIDPVTGEPLLAPTRPYDPQPATLERTR